MTDVLFVQGAGTNVHADWDRTLVESLRRELGPRYEVRYPRMPNEDEPSLRSWGPVLEREIAALRPGGIVVGHSVGGTLALRVLAERLPEGVPIFLYHGDADAVVPVSHVERYAEVLPRAHVRRLAGRDHQLDDDLSAVAGDLREVRAGALSPSSPGA